MTKGLKRFGFFAWWTVYLGTSGRADPVEKSAVTVEPFTLPYWSETEFFSLMDEPESILILDFFAYWCLPCLPASQDLERNVQGYYESKGGNPHGLPVKVLSINVEASKKAKTEAFVRKSGVRHVLDDSGGELLKTLGGNALPHILILSPEKEENRRIWRVKYQQSGYEGKDRIRSIIDAIEPVILKENLPAPTEAPNQKYPETPLSDSVKVEASEPVTQPVEKSTVEEQPIELPKGKIAIIPMDKPVDAPTMPDIRPQVSSFKGVENTPTEIENQRSQEKTIPSTRTRQEFDLPQGIGYYLNAELLASSDILMHSESIQRLRAMDNGEWDFTLSHAHIDIDYEPVPEADVIGVPRKLGKDAVFLQLTYTSTLTAQLEYQLSGGGYDGFSDHSSLWLDEYYRQQFSGIDGYLNANPWGYNLYGGLSWDTGGPAGILNASLVFQQDDVAPGYDRPLFQPLERGRERLYTGSLLIEQDRVFSKKVRMRNQLQVTKTTDREMRYRFNGNLNFALADQWVLRTEAAATYEAVVQEEESDFFSYSIGATLEYDWDERWFIGFTGRAYDDNGQIETSILVSSGPPPLETVHWGVAVRYQGESNSWKFSLASYQTRYEEVDSPIRPFGNLYQNREWLLASASYSKQF